MDEGLVVHSQLKQMVTGQGNHDVVFWRLYSFIHPIIIILSSLEASFEEGESNRGVERR